ncbi:MAG: fumarylacetoacetate hydrolase family protein [Candidatus Cyclonatronum sp.]|uniref:fumarylacetoacetate hydrolase family protein n=1 Tax=Cyclonatronum sp. TaxID=3024185 RepID=UPI0025B9F9AF|nr:fumarylacetoacetate hydrolase family protein [Cyclonatronum sp.]MCH8486287.1 fumarylacetoacetate hydrolase family protein [Cyclonatronum sp.]
MRNIKIPGLAQTQSINSVYCIGRNYAEHAKELNNPIPALPVVFTKPVTAITFDGGEIIIPKNLTRDVHHEAEMVVSIGRTGRFVPESEAMSYISGYAIGIDVTARDLQSALKAKAHPWTLAKGMDTFAPIGNFAEASVVEDPADLSISLFVNGERRQHGNTSDMIFSLPALISFLSQYVTLHKGDLIFTGTPEGVGPLIHGDKVSAMLGKNLSSLRLTVREI